MPYGFAVVIGLIPLVVVFYSFSCKAGSSKASRVVR
jgi:hypothetical protein